MNWDFNQNEKSFAAHQKNPGANKAVAAQRLKNNAFD
jgi:hypothetical protein